jgi:hypothetical protein
LQVMPVRLSRFPQLCGGAGLIFSFGIGAGMRPFSDAGLIVQQPTPRH